MPLRQFDAKNKRVGLLCAQVVVHPGTVEGARRVIGPQQAREHNLYPADALSYAQRRSLPPAGTRVLTPLNSCWFGERNLVLGHRNIVNLQVLGHEQVRGGVRVKRNQTNHGGTGLTAAACACCGVPDGGNRRCASRGCRWQT